MNSLLELRKKIEIDFLKEHSYEEINDMFNELNNKLIVANRKITELEKKCINWHEATKDNMPKEKGWYLVYVVGYSLEPTTCRCEFMGGNWWRHRNWGTIDDYVKYWAIMPEPTNK